MVDNNQDENNIKDNFTDIENVEFQFEEVETKFDLTIFEPLKEILMHQKRSEADIAEIESAFLFAAEFTYSCRFPGG